MNLLMRRRMMMQQKQGGSLPDGYQQVEWIGCTGTQYIKTNYEPVQYDELDATFLINSNQGNNSKVYWSAGTGDYQFILLTNSGNLYYKYFATGDAVRMSSSYRPLDSRMNYSINSSGIITTTNLETGAVLTSATSAYTAPIDSTDKSLYIFRRSDGTTTFFRGRLYKFIIINNGTLKLNLIPCYRKSDNEIGLYDTVGRTFYTNAGTGSFVIPT